MNRRRWMPQLLAMACAVAVVLATSGCSSLARRTAEGGFEAAQNWWDTGGKEKAEALAQEYATKAKDAAVAKAKSYARKKAEESKASLETYLGKSLADAKVTDIPALMQEVRQKEKDTGIPYKPVTGSLMLDMGITVALAYLTSKGGVAAGGKAISAMKAAPNVPPKV